MRKEHNVGPQMVLKNNGYGPQTDWKWTKYQIEWTKVNQKIYNKNA